MPIKKKTQKSAQTRQGVCFLWGNPTREIRERKPVKGKSMKSETSGFETDVYRDGKKKRNKSFVKIVMIMKL